MTTLLILGAMLRLGIRGPALVPLIEPATVDRLFAAAPLGTPVTVLQ